MISGSTSSKCGNSLIQESIERKKEKPDISQNSPFIPSKVFFTVDY